MLARPLSTALAVPAILAFATPALPQTSVDPRLDAPAVAAARTVPAARAGGPVLVDGRLDDAAWEGVESVGGFVQRRPDAGLPASQRSEARVLYDHAAIYVALRLHDSAPDSIAAALGRRDFQGFSDWAHVVIDSYHDRRTAFRFGVNPAGVKADAFLSGDEEWNEDGGWDAVWDGAAARDSLGWTAEMRIPLSQLRFSAAGDSAAAGAARTWGIQFVRDLARRGERSLWAPISPEDAGYVSRFGELRDLRVRPTRRLETVPYLVGRLTRAPGEGDDPFHRSSDLFSSLGLDVRYGVTTDLTLTATVNPDFGQVEADPSQVNLSGSEVFLHERRPFFLEGGDIFRVQPSEAPWIHGAEEVFYTRRLARAPRGSAPDDALYADEPGTTRLLGAAKLSGKTGGGWSVGLLNAVTASEEARYLDAAGREGRVEVEPLTDYTVGRLIRDFREGRSALGGVLAATHRRLGAATDGLVEAAYVGGVDGRHRLGDGNWLLSGVLLASHLRGSSEAIDEVMRGPVHRFQRPDADHLDYDPTRTTLSGTSATARLQKTGGGSLRGGIAGRLTTGGFDANDLGFHTASDFARGHAWVGYDAFRSSRALRRWSLWSNNWSTWSLGGERIATGSELYADATLRSYWNVGGSVRRELAALSPTALRGGPALYLPGRTSGHLSLHSDNRRAVRAMAFANYSLGDDGARFFRLEPGVVVRPSSRVEVALWPAMAWNDHPAMWIGRSTSAAGEHFIGGRLEQRTASLTARLNYTFTPDLSLQLYAQPFLSAGRYAGFREVADPRAADFDRRFRTYPAGRVAATATGDAYRVDRDGDGTPDFTLDNPDFNVRELNSNAVLRWEYRPGSTLFLVWSQGRSAEEVDGTFDLGRDADRLFRLPSTNTLLVKWSHWVGW